MEASVTEVGWPEHEPVLSDAVVTLRTWEERDIPALVEAANDEEIARWTTVPQPFREDHAWDAVRGSRDLYARREAVVLAVVDAVSGDLLGSIGLSLAAHDTERAEISYWVAAPARRRGVATRALTLLTHWALAHLSLERIELVADPRNDGSRKVATRVGYQKEGVLRRYRRIAGERVDVTMYSLLPADVGPAK